LGKEEERRRTREKDKMRGHVGKRWEERWVERRRTREMRGHVGKRGGEEKNKRER